mgnify:CR=1 FL=1
MIKKKFSNFFHLKSQKEKYTSKTNTSTTKAYNKSRTPLRQRPSYSSNTSTTNQKRRKTTRRKSPISRISESKENYETNEAPTKYVFGSRFDTQSHSKKKRRKRKKKL